MKKVVFIINILLIIFSCKTEPKTFEIFGSWYSCAKNGDYIEMHIKGNRYKYSTDFLKPTNWNEFEIKLDTFIQYHTSVYQDSIIIKKAILKRTTNGEFKLKYITSNESLTFKKIDKKIVNIENNILLKKETIQRSKKVKCIDKRNEEERKRDQLNFEF